MLLEGNRESDSLKAFTFHENHFPVDPTTLSPGGPLSGHSEFKFDPLGSSILKETHSRKHL
jgi:hypothetical protein